MNEQAGGPYGKESESRSFSAGDRTGTKLGIPATPCPQHINRKLRAYAAQPRAQLVNYDDQSF